MQSDVIRASILNLLTELIGLLNGRAEPQLGGNRQRGGAADRGNDVQESRPLSGSKQG